MNNDQEKLNDTTKDYLMKEENRATFFLKESWDKKDAGEYGRVFSLYVTTMHDWVAAISGADTGLPCFPLGLIPSAPLPEGEDSWEWEEELRDDFASATLNLEGGTWLGKLDIPQEVFPIGFAPCERIDQSKHGDMVEDKTFSRVCDDVLRFCTGCGQYISYAGNSLAIKIQMRDGVLQYKFLKHPVLWSSEEEMGGTTTA